MEDAMTVVRKEDKPEASWRPGKKGILHAAASVGGTTKLIVNESWNDFGIGAPTHVHPDGLEEIIMVLEGHAEFWINGEHSVLGAGDLVIIPPLAHHGFKNISETETLHVLAVFSSPVAPTIFDHEPDKIVYIGGTDGDRVDSQRTVAPAPSA
ncbi:MAG: cupin domain-containing protein [Actinobacteria bacterium]|nr:cupin domain-containing protein [Actinomycetota bacterium]